MVETIMLILYQTLVIIFILTCFIGSGFIFALLKIRKEMEIKTFYVSAGFFAAFFGISRIYYYSFDFIYVGDLVTWKIAAVIGIISIIFLLFAVEKTVVPGTKFVFTIIGTVILILYLMPFPADIATAIQTFMIPLVAPIIPVVYLYVAIKGTGEARKLAILFFTGSILFITANLFHGQVFNGIDLLYYIISPVLFISSVVVMFYVISQQGKV